MRRVADAVFGVTPVVLRRDGSGRVTLFYARKPHTAPIAKRQSHYTDETGAKYLPEILGTGQHSVIEGPHAKGKRHYWENEGGLIAHGAAMPEVDDRPGDRVPSPALCRAGGDGIHESEGVAAQGRE